jgi:hypothetical protein
MFSQRFHIFKVQSLLVLSQFRIREIMWCHLRWIDRSLFGGLSVPNRFCPWAPHGPRETTFWAGQSKPEVSFATDQRNAILYVSGFVVATFFVKSPIVEPSWFAT